MAIFFSSSSVSMSSGLVWIEFLFSLWAFCFYVWYLVTLVVSWTLDAVNLHSDADCLCVLLPCSWMQLPGNRLHLLDLDSKAG